MLIVRRNPFKQGEVNEMEIPVTQAQLDAWESGELIQNVMPHLTPDQREFIMTGITAEGWNSLPTDDDEEVEIET